MNIAVTGSGGQLGAELCRQLGSRAVGLDLPDFDLTDRDRVAKTLRDIRPAAVINTAAYTQVDKAEEQPELCRAINATGVARLAEVCRTLDCPLVQVSTDYVFGAETTRSTPYRENDAPGPLGIYGQTKLAGEREAAQWEKHVIVRTCGLYGKPGPRTAASNFVDTMLRLAGQRDRLAVVDDQHCTPSYVPDVAQAIGFLLQSGAVGTYHVVNTGRTTWYDLAAEIFSRRNLTIDLARITTAQYGAPAPRPLYSLLDTAKYHALPGCPPMPSWRNALNDYLSANQ